MLVSEKQKILLGILADGKFHSGSDLAETLQISRSAVCKHLQSLRALGLEYAAVNGKGYRLEKPLELLSAGKIEQGLSQLSRKRITALEIHDSLPSTNAYMNRLAASGGDSGVACLAERQTAGKGRRGRTWISPFGHNIYLSLLWRFQSGPAAISGLSLALGVAVIRALKESAPKPYSLKWPNDIYFENKKLGGILIEVTGETEGPSAAVMGIGLNLFLPPEQGAAIDQDWVDLTQIIGGSANLERNKFVSVLLNELVSVLTEFEQKGVAVFLDEWRNYDCMKDKPGKLYVGQQVYEGVIRGIDGNGLLLLSYPNGSVQAFASGEVSFKPPL